VTRHPVEPAVGGALPTGGAAFHVVLGIEVGAAGGVGGAHAVHDGELFFLEEGPQGGKGGVEAKAHLLSQGQSVTGGGHPP
jgi:hypothetical protein